MTVTVFKNILDTEHPHYTSATSIIERIKCGKDKEQVNLIREEQDEKEKKIAKGAVAVYMLERYFYKKK